MHKDQIDADHDRTAIPYNAERRNGGSSSLPIN